MGWDSESGVERVSGKAKICALFLSLLELQPEEKRLFKISLRVFLVVWVRVDGDVMSEGRLQPHHQETHFRLYSA